MSQRTDRIDELLRQEIGAIIAREIADPRVGFATVTGVETAPDLRHARVWVSVIGQEADRQATLRALGRAMPFVRHELGKRLHLKRIPEFHLELDDTVERGTRVLQLLNELEAGNVPHEPTPDGESLPTPVARIHHVGDAPDEPPSAAEPPLPPRRRAFRPGKSRTVPGKRRR
jgi:ribosome-binding factor A